MLHDLIPWFAQMASLQGAMSAPLVYALPRGRSIGGMNPSRRKHRRKVRTTRGHDGRGKR